MAVQNQECGEYMKDVRYDTSTVGAGCGQIPDLIFFLF